MKSDAPGTIRLRLRAAEGQPHGVQARKPDGGTITVPVPDHNELKTGTLHGIIEQSRLARELFEAE